MKKLHLLASAMLAGAFLFAVRPGYAGERLSDKVSDKIAPVAGALPDAQNVPAMGQTVPIPYLDAGMPKSAKPVIPQGAKRFLPNSMTKAAKDMLYDKDSAITQKRVQELEALFNKYYGDVVYHVEWDDDTVNAYAWQEEGEKHVAILGGLARHKAMKSEGISLVIAHETGHHYAGAPYYPGQNMSCEGQSDYWGAGVAMRKAFSGSYRDTMLTAIDQINTLFTGGLESTPSEEDQLKAFKADSCSHPPAACRKQTYLAAMDNKPKPACAGLEEDKNVAQAPAKTSGPVALAGI